MSHRLDGNANSIRIKACRNGVPAISKNFDVKGLRQSNINPAMRKAETCKRAILSRAFNMARKARGLSTMFKLAGIYRPGT